MSQRPSVIEEVAKRLNVSESIVEKVIRSAEMDCRDFLAEKKGYNIWWPNLGTFHFRVSYLIKFIQIQRRQLAYWTMRLEAGVDNINTRTITAAQENIKKHSERIQKALLIKKEYLDEHCGYNKNKKQYQERTAHLDMARLGDILNVDDIIASEKEKNPDASGDMSELSDEWSL